MAELFIQDQLRGSPLLSYSQGLDALTRDANRLAGVQHRLLGREIGAGFKALNPGLARGVLYAKPDMKAVEAFRPTASTCCPETVSELPPVAGILTAGAGNPLSHVQLLARNLGIPNVAVDSALLPELRRERRQAHRAGGQPGGPGRDRTRTARSGTRPSARRPRSPAEQTVMFAPDLSKLDSGAARPGQPGQAARRRFGPHRRPQGGQARRVEVAFPGPRRAGVGIPFGLYRAVVLDKPYKGGGKTVYQWMVESFRKLEALPAGSAEAGRAARRCAPRSTASSQHRPRAEIPRAAARGDGTASSAPTSRAACSSAATPTSRTCPASPAPA